MTPRRIAALPMTRLGPEHAPLVAALEQICFDEPWSVEQCRRALLQPACAAFGLLAPPEIHGPGKSELLAYISLYAVKDEMEVLNLAVLPPFRRMGLARRLLALALQSAYKMGIEKASLEARESNGAAIALYTAFGFTALARRERYYANGEAALVMGLDLASRNF